MKKLRVTLNQKMYEVTVEVLEDDEGHYPGSFQPAWPAAPPAPAAPVAAPPVIPPTAPVGPASPNAVIAPIVGTITKILVAPGDAVTENQPLVILDAMKMDTYINSTSRGTVESVLCQTGDSVQVGQKLITLR